MNYDDVKYKELRGLIVDMCSSATDMVVNSIKALVERDDEIAKQVIVSDKHVNQLDVAIDILCQQILALYEPKAMDLRYILSISRIITDLERIGDHSVAVSREAIKLNKVPQFKPYIDIPRMAEHAVAMVKDAVEAYFEKDIEKAKDIIKRDDFINDLQSQIIRELMTYVSDDRLKVDSVVWLMFVARRLERIADHAKNIAELVPFIVTGKITRHQKIEE